MSYASSRSGRVAAGLLAAAAVGVFAQPTLSPLKAYVNYEFGQIQDGTDNAYRPVEREMINHSSVWLSQEASLNEHARVRYGVGAAYFFALPRKIGDNPYVHSKRSAVGLTEAYGEFDIAESGDDMLLQLKTGVFGYKYNPDAKNLGEYMYRTWTYPNVITTGGLEFINSAGVQLSGAAAHTRVGGLKNDLLLTIETDRPPIFGLSLADVVSYQVGIFEVGAGFMFNHFYTPDPEQVQPSEDVRNSYVTLQDGRRMARSRFDFEQSNLPIGAPPDTIVATDYYTFEGQKVMGRASASFGKLLGGPFADHELKLYGEVIVLGLKNYPTYYEKLSDRIVYMGGFNLPAFGLLDMLSVEVEYAPNPFENSVEGPYLQKSVTPYIGENGWNDYDNGGEFTKDDVKWTVYARKNIYEGFSLNLQVANDHIRMFDQFSAVDHREYLQEKKAWYWAVKMAYAL